MKLFHLLVICCLCTLAFSSSPSKGRKITFLTDTEVSAVEYNDNPVKVGTEEYYNNYRWVAVTSDGYETEGTLEEAKAFITSEDVEEEDEYEVEENGPATSPPHTLEEDESNEEEEGAATEEEEDESYNEAEVKTEEEKQGENEEEDDESQVTNQRVFGYDSRKKVYYTYRHPYRTMGRIDIGCTGTLVARRTVLTAGHCVYKTRVGWYKHLNFRRGKRCDPNPGQLFTWKRAVTYHGWTTKGIRKYDIAIITLYKKYPYYMPFGFRKYLKRKRIYIAGYPGDKCGSCLWTSSCTVRRAGSIITHRCDTNKGMSGSAVYTWNWRRRFIVGVHTFGAYYYNGATRITRSHNKKLRQWMRQFGGL